ncbi:sugar ABC transporter ATP-binding protein [Nocardioides zeae]|uniref:ABC-type sugar transport system ATPase subunit n=1 Tax=Nocardioides zeae TaxID=1457234 RepID=A0AAJ1X2M3_9ACTN|nr:sugar ABC transporter ATP-binding protein [Nocardioides zeae]MDQ1106823.1 ABC-type sugar transport system ATPase subunit [Nocardioides zeae]
MGTPEASTLAPATAHAAAIRTHGVGRTFGAAVALAGIDVTITAGTVHALVGQNGAGKSTLLGILAGRIEPTSGEFEVFGERVSLGSPRAARQAGIAAIYQELTIIPQLTAMANVFVSRPRSRGGLLDERAMRRRYDELSARLGVHVPPDAIARDLSVAQQQLLEIMRALDAEARVIFFDEPTAPLGPSEREALFALMRDLRDQGVTMVFVSHALDEVLAISDDVTVFRDGRLRASRPTSTWTKQSLVDEMLGRSAEAALAEVAATTAEASAPLVPTAPRHPAGAAARTSSSPATEEPGLRVRDLFVSGSREGVSFEVRGGEMVGIGGLVGAGRSSVLRALAGLDRRARGELWIDGRQVPWPRTVRQALRHGIALLPEDRKTQGLVLGMSAMENVTLSDLGAVATASVVSMRRMRRAAGESAAGYGFDVRRLDEPARNLSGGNQQKLLLARWGHRRPRFLLADEPTRGIDVGAKAEILATLQGLAAEGMGVLLVSSELEEVATSCTRVFVMSSGRVVAEHPIDLAARSVEDTVADILYAAFHVEETHV